MIARAPGAAASPPPSGKLDFNFVTLDAGTLLHRIHDSRFAATAFNPGFGNSRFAPVKVADALVPTAYAATSLECAAFETIFHDLDAGAALKIVPLSRLGTLHYSTFELRRPLRLASLYSADLMRFGVERQHVIDTPPSTYSITRLWSPAAYQSSLTAQGMIWVSRKYDQERALMLFGDRVTPDAIMPAASARIVDDARTLETLFELGQRAGINITG